MRAVKHLAIGLLGVLLAGLLLKGTLPQVPTGTWVPAGSLFQPRSGSAAVALQDGRILFTGGNGAAGPLASAELFDADGSISGAPDMPTARANHTATVLKDGRVLVAGGTTSGGGVTNAAEIYDPNANTWTAVSGGMSVPRSGHTASLLSDGTVLVAGGQSSGAPTNTLEIFDPVVGTFTAASDTLASPRQNHAAAVLQNGQVLIVGGFDGTNVLNTSDIYDPSSGLVNPGPTLISARQSHTATTQLDGRVLVADGNNLAADLASAEVFDPVAGSFTATGAPAIPRQGHLAFRLPNNGGILIVGGVSNGVAQSSAELYYPWTRTFNTTGAMTSARSSAAGAPPGQSGVLLVGGGTDASGNTLSSVELYGFATVQTDKADYQPGQTVTITGSGWQPGETVTLSFLESPLIDTHPQLTAVADGNGNFVNTQFSPDAHDLQILFYLTATGSVSQAQTVFTDGTAANGDGTMVVSPTIVAAASTGNTLTFTFTAPNGKNFNSNPNSQAAILVPAGWTVPTSGNVAVSGCGGTATLGSITGSGPWTVPINMACNGGDSFTATYGPTTAPGTAGANQFTTKTKQSGGILTNISGQPTVTVQAASQLVFSQQPTSTQAGSSITPAITVQIQDANGDLANTNTASVTIAIGTNPGGGTLGGTTTVNAVNGVATFSNLSINKTGTNYTLTASSSGLTSAPSSAFNVTPGNPTQLQFAQQPSNTQAGSSITPAVTVQILDANNNLVHTGTGSTASVSMAIGTNPSGGTLTGTTTVNAVGGVATFSNLSINKVGNGYTLVASSSGLTGATSNAFNIGAGTVSASNSTVSANPASVPADGSTASTITVTLLDSGGNPVSGKNVTLTAGSGSSTITVVNGTTNASGQATFKVTDTKAEGVTYTAKDTSDSITITPTATVTFTAGTVNATTSTVSANPGSVVADGVSTSTITVTLKDVNNNPVSGKTVTLTPGGGNSTINPASATTNTSGVATFTVTDSTVEQITYTAKDTSDSVTVTQTATVNFTVGPVNAGTSTVTANPTTVPADGSTTSTITVTLKDASGRAVSGKTVTLSQGTGSSTISPPSGVSNPSGVVTFAVKDTKGEVVTYTGTDITDSVTITQTAQVTFTNPAPTTTSISPTSQTAGATAFTLTVNGANFVTTSVVNFNGSARSTSFVNSSQVTAQITAADVATAGSFPITVTNPTPGGGTSNPQTFTVNPKLAFTTNAFAILTGVCSSQVSVQIQNGNGSAATLGTATVLSLSTNSGTGSFYSDAVCGTPISGNNVTIAAGSSTASFFYKDTTISTPTITVASAGLTSIQQGETITGLRFGSTAFSIPAGQCSAALSLQSANAQSGSPTSLTQTTTINLGTTSGTGQFFSDAACTAPITTPTISPTIDAGHDSPSFFYKDTVAGSPTLSGSTGTAAATQVETITKAIPVFTNLTAAQSITYGTASVNLSGTIGSGTLFPPSGENVSITINGAMVQTPIGANGAFSTSVDTHAIPASAAAYPINYGYPGDANFNTASNSSTTLTVNKANTTTTISTISPEPSNILQQYTVNWTLSPQISGTPTGMVNVNDGNGNGCSASVAAGSCSLASTTPGAKTITATYSGDSYFNGSAGNKQHNVNNPATTTAVTSSQNPSAFGQPVTITAMVTSASGTPTGSISFYDGACGTTLLAGPTNLNSSGQASFNTNLLSVGPHNINACFTPTGIFLGSSGSVAQSVTTAAPVVSDSGPGSSTYGQSVTLTVTVAPPYGGTPTGTVTFTFTQNSATYYVCSNGIISTTDCTVNVTPSGESYIATVTTNNLPPGTDGVMATYSGDADFQGEAANNVSVTVSQADSAITLTSSEQPATYGDQVTLTVKVKDNTNNSAGVPSGTVALSFKLDPTDPKGQVYYVCADGTLSTTACAAPNQITLASANDGVTATASVPTTYLPAGLSAQSFAYTINASYSGDPNFKASAPVGLAQTVNQRPISVTAATDTKVYDGTTSSKGAPTITSGSLVNGDTGNFTQTFNTRNAGNNLTLIPAGSVKDGFGGSNYTITFVPVSTGTITQLPITVTAVTDAKVYNSTVISGQAPTIAPTLVGGDTSGFFQAFDSPNAGPRMLVPMGAANDGNGGQNYLVKFVNAAGSIGQASLTITAVMNTKTYDGTTSAAATPAVMGLQGNTDSVTGLTETYDTPNAGTGKTLTVSPGYTISDGNNGGNYSVTLVANTTGVINQATPIVTDGGPGNSVFGQQVTFTVTVAAPDGGTPTGTVTFSFVQNATTYYICAPNGNISQSPCNVPVTVSNNSYTASVTTSQLPTAADQVMATYSGDGNFTSGGANNVSVTVSQADSAITLMKSADPSTYGDAIDLTVKVTDNTGGSAGVPSGTVVLSFQLDPTDPNGQVYYICSDGTLSTTPCANQATLEPANDGVTATATVHTTTLPAGLSAKSFAYPINASYSGDTNFKASLPFGLLQTVNQRAITVTAAMDTKTYDGTTSSKGMPTITNGSLVSKDTGNFTQTFDTRNAGSNKTLTPAGSVNDGFGGNNYTITFTPVSTGTINQLAITVTAVADAKTYDATTSSKGTPTISPALISPDTSNFSQTFDTKNVGMVKTLTPAGSVTDGNGGRNYAVTVASVKTGEIDAAPLIITAVYNTKVYDATTSAKATPTVSGLQGTTDTVTGLVETYDTKNVSTGKTLSVTAYTVNDGNGGNDYKVSTMTVTTGVITQTVLTVIATGVNKVYDGTPAATVTLSDNHFGNDMVTDAYAGASFVTPNAGAGIQVNVTGISISGADATNYAYNTAATTSANITQATSSVTVTPLNNPSNWGLVAGFSATVSPQIGGTPTGAVTFYNAASGASCAALGASTPIDDPVLMNGTASTSTSALPVGSDTILACYSGDNNFMSSKGTTMQTVVAAPIVSINPANLSFGNQQVNTTSGAQTVTITNPTGTAPLNISNISITGTDPTYFIETDNCKGTSVNYGAGYSCVINIQFSPPATGAASAVLNITDNNENASGSVQSIPLMGASVSTINGVGSLPGFALFATGTGCSSINGSGGIVVNSFSGPGALPQNSGGNVGTNGNDNLSGNAAVYGTSSSPFGGSGTCSAKSMTGYSTSGKAEATGGPVQLQQPISYPTPTSPSPAPPTSNENISGSCGSVPGCTSLGSKAVSLAPGAYGNLNISGGTTAHFTAGTYVINSLTASGNSNLIIDSTPVVLNLAGISLGNNASVVDLSGGTMSNPSGDPSKVEMYYGGNLAIKLSGGTGSFLFVYAPRAPINISGGSHFYGSIIGNTINDSGGTAIHYDTNLPSINAGDYIWFSSAALNVQGLPAGQNVKLYVTNASLTFNGNTYSVPNAVITLSATATSASTTWDSVNNRWNTLVPSSMVSGNANASIHTFLDGLAFPVPANLPNGIQNATWSAAFSTDTPGISFQWQWGAAVYSAFSSTQSSLGVKAIDTADPAGTPENYKTDLILGGTGAGPIGMYMGIAGVVPTIAEASTAPSTLDFSNGGKVIQPDNTQSPPMMATLTNNQSGPLAINSIQITGADPGDFIESDNCPISPNNTLGGGLSCTITVTFKPTASGKRSAKVTINDNANNTPQTIYLTGDGQ